MTDPNQPGYPPPGGQPGYPPPGGQPGYPPPGAEQPAGQRHAGAQSASQGPSGVPKRKRAVSTGQILGGILFVLLIIFIVENSHNVAIRIIVGPEIHPPVWVAIVIAAVLGGLIAALLRYRRHVGARRKQLVREHRAENTQQPPQQ